MAVRVGCYLTLPRIWHDEYHSFPIIKLHLLLCPTLPRVGAWAAERRNHDPFGGIHCVVHIFLPPKMCHLGSLRGCLSPPSHSLPESSRCWMPLTTVIDVTQFLTPVQRASILAAALDVRYSSMAALSLLVYDYFLTLDNEIRFFWAGPWRTSRVLFLINRYSTPLSVAALITCISIEEPSAIFCYRAYIGLFAWWFTLVSVVQAILVIRVWYLFRRAPRLRRFVIMLFVATVLVSAGLLANYFKGIRPWEMTISAVMKDGVPFRQRGCPGPGPPSPPPVWPFLAPSLVLHTVLYLLTTYVALTSEDMMKTALSRRMVRDGGLFYLVVFITSVFTICASALATPTGIRLRHVATLSQLPFTILSISIGRVMLSIRTLAANTPTPDDWIMEMIAHQSMGHKGAGTEDIGMGVRTRWRQGAHQNEFFVDVENTPGEFAMAMVKRSTRGSSLHSDVSDWERMWKQAEDGLGVDPPPQSRHHGL